MRTLFVIAIATVVTACGMSADRSLPVYTTEQTDSAHPGYRRTIVSTAGAEYVNDFEEQSLQIINTDPKRVVGRSRFGNGKICAIDGDRVLSPGSLGPELRPQDSGLRTEGLRT